MSEIFGDFRGPAVRLTAADIDLIAREAGIEAAALRAVMKIESAGSGYDSSGRPKILFEPHIFHKLLPDGLRATAVAAGVAYARWGEQPYPKGSDAQYTRLSVALGIDRDAALKSASWGLGQVMGSNHRLAGYDDVAQMVLACMDSEASQLRMQIAFIKNAGLLDEIQRHDWAGFARGYNGPAYAKNAYDTKLAEAYRALA